MSGRSGKIVALARSPLQDSSSRPAMETSTPIQQSKPRVSFSVQKGPAFSPLKRDRANVSMDLISESNDDAERAERRRSVALRRSILALPSANQNDSAALNDSVRKMSDDDLKSQLQLFCKLNAENKISVKNAWNLRIIDVLKQIVSKDHPDVLKVAGNSLEIAGKVYGLRVDDLHAMGLKLAGSLARNFANKGQDDEDNEENADPNAPGDENRPKQKKPKKKRNLLSTDKRNIINSEPKAFLAPLPKLESSVFSCKIDPGVSATGNLFTNRVRMDPAGYKFLFGSKEKAWNWTPGNDPSVKSETNKKYPLKIPPVKNFILCAPFKDFRMDMWDPEQDKEDSLRKPSVLEDVVLDENGIPIAELDGSIHDVFEERNEEDFNDDDPVEAEEVRAPLIREDIEHIVNFIPSERGLSASTEKSAYSFNNLIETCYGKIDQIWAGPSHWKFKYIRRAPLVYSGQDRHEQKDGEQTKKKVAKKKKEYEKINLWDLPPPKDFSKTAKKPYKKKNCILDSEKVTLPILDSSCVKLLENIEYLMTVPTMKPEKKKSPDDVDYKVNEYDYNNPNDTDYCPQQPDTDDNGADLGDDLFDNGDMQDIQQSLEEGGFVGTNLVDAPQMVQQTYMHYATRAKKMDMKKLKQAVWMTLTRTSEYDESAKVSPTKFSEMYRDLPKILPERMNAELSCPIAFVALLHLSNEQSLKLIKQNDITDFGIEGPA